ncbi:MAG: DRTGG domain-containing protein, partial [bacterium]
MYDQNIYVVGHTQPDTDCVASAIAYSAYLNKKGRDTRPAVAGTMNPETRYLLRKFGIEEPVFLDDARVRLDQIELDSPVAIREDTSLLEAVRAMDEHGREALAITDENWKIRGWVSRSDISRLSLTDTLTSASLLKDTPASFFARAVNGVVVYDDPLMELNGQVSIVTAATKKSLRHYEVKNRIVIVGNEETVQEQLIEKGAGLLIVVWARKIDSDVLEAARAHHCPVILSGFGATNTSRYIFLA